MENLTNVQVFAALGVVLIILEMVTPGFVMLPIGVSFLITSAVIPFVPELSHQLMILAITLTITFIFFHKYIRPKFSKQRFKSNVDSLVGQTAAVEEEINPTQGTGYIKIYGDHWKAITIDGSMVEVGKKVVVERVDGNKLFVRKA